MRCNQCGSEWNIPVEMAKAVKTCPFCGAALKPESDDLWDTFRWIIQDRGVSVFDKPNLINAILDDMAHDREKERKRIRQALNAGAGSKFHAILERNGGWTEYGSREFHDWLADDFNPEFCEYIVGLFQFAMTGKMPQPPEKKLETPVAEHSEASSASRKSSSSGPKTRTTKASSKSSAAAPKATKSPSTSKTRAKSSPTPTTLPQQTAPPSKDKLLYSCSFGAAGYAFDGSWKTTEAIDRMLYVSEEGLRYDGSMVHALPEGQGTVFYPGGAYMKGKFKAGKTEGPVRIVFSEGISYYGGWSSLPYGPGAFKSTGCNGIKEVSASGMWSGLINGTAGKLQVTDQSGNKYRFEGNFATGIMERGTVSAELTGKNGAVSWKGSWADNIFLYSEGTAQESATEELTKATDCLYIAQRHIRDVLKTVVKQYRQVRAVYPDGSEYRGCWGLCENGERPVGEGSFRGTACKGFDEVTYEGVWENGMPKGLGCLTAKLTDGTAYQFAGDFRYNGMPSRGWFFRISGGKKIPVEEENYEYVTQHSAEGKKTRSNVSEAVGYILRITHAASPARVEDMIRDTKTASATDISRTVPIMVQRGPAVPGPANPAEKKPVQSAAGPARPKTITSTSSAGKSEVYGELRKYPEILVCGASVAAGYHQADWPVSDALTRLENSNDKEETLYRILRQWIDTEGIIACGLDSEGPFGLNEFTCFWRIDGKGILTVTAPANLKENDTVVLAMTDAWAVTTSNGQILLKPTESPLKNRQIRIERLVLERPVASINPCRWDLSALNSISLKSIRIGKGIFDRIEKCTSLLKLPEKTESFEVNPENTNLVLANGMLCCRGKTGRLWLIRCPNGSKKTVQEGIYGICSDALSDCEGTLEIPESVHRIGSNAFHFKAGKLRNVSIRTSIVKGYKIFAPDGNPGSDVPYFHISVPRDFEFSLINDSLIRGYSGHCTECGGRIGFFGKCARCGKKQKTAAEINIGYQYDSLTAQYEETKEVTDGKIRNLIEE